MPEFEILINGEKKITNSSTVAQLLDELSLSGKAVAVELNKEIVRKNFHSITPIAAGDVVELVHFVGGG